DVRVRRVARDRVRLDPCGLQFLSPVTQELELTRSGRGPVEEIEQEQDRAIVEKIADRRALARSRPDHRLERRSFSRTEHQTVESTGATSVASAISRTTSTMSRFEL